MVADLEIDYLITGSGAVGMAFADTIIAETDAYVMIVDREADRAATGTRPIRSSPSTSHRPSTASTHCLLRAAAQTKAAPMQGYMNRRRRQRSLPITTRSCGTDCSRVAASNTDRSPSPPQTTGLRRCCQMTKAPCGSGASASTQPGAARRYPPTTSAASTLKMA